VTLVEMLVTLAVLLLMMTAIVQIFQAATSALNGAQVYQELDNQLRRLDGTIRSDLRGVTARMTPPLNPKDNLGYFEYGENSFADLQGEDCDDYVRFTAKAPAGHPFVGRVWPQPVTSGGNQVMNTNTNVLPITITSDYAEIIYFLRNGNLYRRVLLVAPDRQSSIVQSNAFTPVVLGGFTVSWQGVNDLSAHPAPTGPNANITATAAPIVLNALGDLTNRENRFAAPRFANDFCLVTGAFGTDGVPDDLNTDGIPDFYPTLYTDSMGALPAGLIFAPGYALPSGGSFLTMAFPYVYPGAYTHPEHDPTTTIGVGAGGVAPGWIHTPIPDYTQYPFDGTLANSLLYLQRLNHAPIDVGDNLFTPSAQPPVNTAGSLQQTWWGFPTWRETLSAAWSDPTVQVNLNLIAAGTFAQPAGLNPRDPSIVVANDGQLLPSMSALSAFRIAPQPYADDFGNGSGIVSTGNNLNLWNISWEDELIMTGVRSFDIKAYDDLFGGFVDLGWGDDARLTNVAPGYLTGTPSTSTWGGRTVDTFTTMAHEGRMPPLTADQRFDYQFGQQYYPGLTYNGNVGDDRNTVVRLRRVWETWSTEYTNAPAYAINNSTASAADNDPTGPPFSPPIYPSYPPPYPAPLKGIQIQIRVTDPTNQRVKQMTIRHDFTDRQ